ncbi:LysM peptidoglycan-binding domain-containing protein [Fontibacillus sp. BL9]|uniref:LysM peptidoglycan-binding domain-containing protein n=1 Tax=Fontibacillus sp. BL9 TaxID=3389971 RepID=UPI003978AF83
MSDYFLTLSFNNEAEAIEFPVLPENIEVSQSGNDKTYNISNLGEINVPKGTKLQEVKFESFFPASWFPGCNVTERELFQPSHYIDDIQKWQSKKREMHLVLTGNSMNINMLVTIDKFTWSESGGAVGDIQYQISFKEYRYYAAKKAQVQTDSSGSKTVVMNKNNAAPRPDTRVKPKTYTLVAGDNLWKVAQKMLGDGSKYKQIQTLNGIKDSELKKLQVGKVIKLP